MDPDLPAVIEAIDHYLSEVHQPGADVAQLTYWLGVTCQLNHQQMEDRARIMREVGEMARVGAK